MKTRIDWKEMGIFISLIVNTYKTIADVLKRLQVDGGGFVEWINGPGKAFFRDAVEKVGEEYIKTTRPLLVSDRVDLYGCEYSLRRGGLIIDPDPKSEYDICDLKKMSSGARIELWFDSLRICANEGGETGKTRKVILIDPHGSIKNTSKGFSEKNDWPLSHLFLEFLKENRDFIPREWGKMCASGEFMFFCFLGTRYVRRGVRDSSEYVQVMSRDVEGEWHFCFMSLTEVQNQISRVVIPCFDRNIISD